MSQHIDQEELMKKAAELKDVVSDRAVKAFEKASEMSKHAAPHVMEAVDKTVKSASPYVDTATEKAAKLTSKAGEALDRFHDEMVEDYLPRLSAAVGEAVEKAKDEAEVLEHRVKAAVETPAPVEIVAKKRSRGRAGKVARWTLLAGAAAGVGYLVWRRSQPIEDPWAEEYWADLDVDVPEPEAAPEEPAVAEEAPAPEVSEEVAAELEEAVSEAQDELDKEEIDNLGEEIEEALEASD